MAVKIKLMRLGKIREPHYRIVVSDARTRRGGEAIETIGQYHPKEEPSFISVSSDRAQYWLGVGAQPTEPVQRILEVTGDWQKFKGLPGAEGTLKVREAKQDKRAVFEAALAAADSEAGAEAITTRKKGDARKGGQSGHSEPTEQPAEAAVEEVSTEAKGLGSDAPEGKSESGDAR